MKKLWEWAMGLDQGLNWPCHILHNSEGIGLLELEKAHLKCQLGRNTLQGKNTAILDALYTANRRPLYGSVSLIGRINRSWDQRVESGVASLIVTLSDSPGETLLVTPKFWTS